MGLQVVTPAASEPITLTEAKAQLRIEFSDDDTLIGSLIKSARSTCEDITKRQLITATYKLTLDCFPAEIIVPKAPLQSVSSIKYYDTDGDLQTLNSDLYQVDAESEPAIIVPAYNQNFPDTRAMKNAVEVEFIAGYGDASTDIPEKIRDACLLYLTWRYEDREGLRMKPQAIDDLLSHYIVSIYI